jgi:hypothetical protein
MNKVNCEQLLIKWRITPVKRAALNREVHRLMPELTQFEEILQARKRKGEDMSLKKCKDSFNYLYLQDNLMFMQAGVTLANNPIVKSYKLVFGDKFSDNFQRFIEKMLPAAEESQSSSSSSKDHATSVLSFSESSAEQVWIFDQLSLSVVYWHHYSFYQSMNRKRKAAEKFESSSSSLSASSSSSSKDHAPTVLSSSPSPVQQVWIFARLT